MGVAIDFTVRIRYTVLYEIERQADDTRRNIDFVLDGDESVSQLNRNEKP